MSDEVKLLPCDLLRKLLEETPEAYVSERDGGWFTVDGLFNLNEIAEEFTRAIEATRPTDTTDFER